MKRVLDVLLFTVCLLFTHSHTGVAEPLPYVMKVGIGNPVQANNFGWTPFEVLQKKAEAFSGGRLKLKLYPEFMGKSSLEMTTMVRDGVVHARDFAGGHLATIYPPLQVISIPYLFAEREVAWKVLDGPFGQKLIESMARETGLRPLYWIENGGFRHFSNNKRPIHGPDDMAGMRIRTMESPLHLQIVRDLGARGVAIHWGDLYGALATGLVDGQENSVSTFRIPHLEKVQGYMVLDGHVYGLYTLLVNDAWYQSLPGELKVALERARNESLVVNRGLSVLNELDNIAYLEGLENFTLYRPTREERQEFKARTQSSAITWLRENVGDSWVDGVLEATRLAEQELGYTN